MPKVLVVYELIPEDTIISVVDMAEEEYEFFSKAHNCYINVGDFDDPQMEEANLVISNALDSEQDHKQYCTSDKQREYFGKWKRLDPKKDTDIAGVEKLIHCGFYL